MIIEPIIRFPVEGQIVVGTLCLQPGSPAPAMVMLHGSTGNRDEKQIAWSGIGLFAHTGSRLAEAGLAGMLIASWGNREQQR